MASNTTESLDTNIIMRIILKDVPEQCEKILDLFMRKGYSYDISDLAVTETVYNLQKSHSRTEIVSALKIIFDLPHINANFTLFNQVFPMYLEHPKLSFNDCCLAAYAALNQSEPLWTFDQTLAKQSPTAKLLA